MQKNILIVEDDYTVALTLKTKLNLLGYNVSGVIAEGKSAVEAVRTTPPDLILMDVTLAGEFDGIAAARQIREFSDIPVIFLTALSDDTVLESIKDINSSAFLIKPFDGKELKFNILIALQKYESDKRIKESEEKYRTLFETLSQGIIILDGDGKIIDANPESQNILGISLNEMTFSSLQSEKMNIVNEDGSPFDVESNSIMMTLRSGERVKDLVIGFFNKKQQMHRWINLNATPQFRSADDSLFQIFAAFEDITRKKKIEEALLESREQYRKLIENQGEGVGFVDADEIFTFANRAAERIFGVPDGGLKGRCLKEFLASDQIKIVEAETKSRIKGQNNTYELEILCPNDLRRIILITVSAKFDKKSGKFLGSFGIFRDISEQKLARVEVQKALEKEKELNQLKSRFISTVSHEYRTPLTSILTSSELLERYKHKWSDEKKSEVLSRIQKSVDYMISMLNDVLTINKAESEKIDFNPVYLDLVQVCRESFDEISLQVSESYEMIFMSDVQSAYGKYDDKLLRQILANLLSNSVKYSPAGGRIELSISQRDDLARITLKDQGIGISEADQKRLFEPFFRGSNVSAISGTGLGLSIVKRALDLHGGRIRIKSSPDNGSEFLIELASNN